MKSFLSIIFLSMLPMSLYAQNTMLEGVVTDSLQQPIELANVMAFYNKDSTVASFGVTDGAGRYRLVVPSGEVYTLKSSFMGYETWENEIMAIGEVVTENVMLRQSSTMLHDVEISYEFPITVSGDTIIYKADQFTSGKERKLGDVIEAIPGFEIDEDGEIKVQGKAVSKVLVEGKAFFDGDSKMAVENIPADAVDKIQLLRNFSEVSPMSGLGNDDNLAINITLDPDKKNMWFGDVELVLGPKDRYLAHPNLFYYSPKTNVNLIGDANNIGKQAFTLRDYFRFSGGVSSVGQGSGSRIDLSSDEMGMSLMQNNMAQNIDSKLAAVNVNYQPNKKWRFSAFGIASGIETLMNTTSNRTYIRSNGETVERTTSTQMQENKAGLLKVTGAFTPSYKAHLEYGAFIKASDISENDHSTSDFGQMTNDFNEIDQKKPFSFDQNLSAYFNLNEKNILSVETSLGYKRQIPEYRLCSDVMPLANVLNLETSDSYQLLQTRRIVTNAIKTEANHYYVMNKTNHINFTLGIDNSQQTFSSGLFQSQDNAVVIVGQEAFANDVSFKYRDNYGGVHYKTKFGKLTLSPGLNVHAYRVSNEQQGSDHAISKTLLMPDFFAKYDFASSKNMVFNYGLKAQFTDVQNVAAHAVMQNYNSFFIGNRALENVRYHELNLNFFNFNMFNHTNVFVMANYQKRFDTINESVAYDGTDRFSTPQNSPTWNDQLLADASIEKTFLNVRLKSKAKLIYNTYQNRVEQFLNNNSSFGQEYSLSAESKFSNAPNFEIGFKKGWNTYTTNAVSQEYRTNIPYADVEIPFLKSFTLIVDYEYTNYQNSTRTTVSNYDFMKAALYYEKEDSPWEFKLSANNLLETEAIRRDGFFNNIVSSYSYRVQPRYVTLSVKYNL